MKKPYASGILGILVLVVAIATSVHAEDASISGIVSVTDGDTIRMGETRIRLSGIDAPESGAMCGGADVYAQSRAALEAIVGQNTVTCAVLGEDRYGRKTATCRVGGADIAASIVEQGWARDWRRYSNGAYGDEEAAARAAHRGIWEHDCPEIWGNRNYN